MRVGIVGHCHVHGIGDALQHLLGDAEIVVFEFPRARSENLLEQAGAALAQSDVLFSHFIPDELGPLSTSALSAVVPKTVMLPGLSFTGFHPDCIYLAVGDRQYASAVGAYHSGIVAAGYALGLDAHRTSRLFNAFIFRKLGYFEEFAKAKAFLGATLSGDGMRMDDEWRGWMAGGVFMHTINHPRVNVLASVAKLAAAKAGLVAVETPTPALAFDWLSNDTIWPLYPELAEALGLAGSYDFKRAGAPLFAQGRSVFIGLSQFIADCYALYETYPRAVFEGDDVARIKAVIGELL